MLVVQEKFNVLELVKDICPDRTPNVEQAKVVSASSITAQDGISIRPHVVVKDRVKPKHMNLVRFVSSRNVMCRHVPAIKVCCALIALSGITRDVRIELSYLR